METTIQRTQIKMFYSENLDVIEKNINDYLLHLSIPNKIIDIKFTNTGKDNGQIVDKIAAMVIYELTVNL